MGCPRVCVVTSSATIQETVAIVLGPAFDVLALSPEQCTAATESLAAADLLIISGEVSPTAALVRAAARLPLLRFETQTGRPRLRGRKTATLSLSFRPEQLRQQVKQLLEGSAGDASRTRNSFLEYPLIPRDLEDLAQRAAATRTPVLISGEPGTGKSRLARAIHAAGMEDRFAAVSPSNLTADALTQIGEMADGSLTLYVNDIARLGADGQQILLEVAVAGGFESPLGWHACRLICATTTDLSTIAAEENLDADLFYRLSVLPVTLPPLRDRANDIGDLAAALARDLGEFPAEHSFSFTERAIRRMERYMWFGNLVEMEAVLLRSMTMASSSTIDVDDVLFDSTRVGLRSQSAAAANPTEQPAKLANVTGDEVESAAPAGPIPTDTVDLVIQELANEFRNPMVTIKTLTQRLERLLEDKTSRDQLTRLTGEAVDRMDRALENLIQFTRFGKPVMESVQLAPLITNCLSQLSPAFAERQVLLNYEPPESLRVEVDGAQVGYALENLLRVVLRDLRDGDTLAIHPLNGHGISLEFPARGQLVAEKLARMADHPPDNDAGGPSIGFFFAKALVERNGGRIEIHPQIGRTVIAVALPPQGDGAAKNGNTPNSSSR